MHGLLLKVAAAKKFIWTYSVSWTVLKDKPKGLIMDEKFLTHVFSGSLKGPNLSYRGAQQTASKDISKNRKFMFLATF